MKRILLITLCFLCHHYVVEGQTNYLQTGDLNGNGYTYKCVYMNPGKCIRLFNKNYTYYADGYKTQKFKDTGEVFYLIQHEKEDQTFDDEETMRIIDGNARCYLAPYQQVLRENELLMEFVINSTTGKISEVYFEFMSDEPYTQLPLSVYRNIELALIGTQFKLTDFGKRLNYLYMWWAVAP